MFDIFFNMNSIIVQSYIHKINTNIIMLPMLILFFLNLGFVLCFLVNRLQ